MTTHQPSDPLVTVITAAYNRATFLDETIRSVLDQDYPNIEYIVLDDGSTDHTSQVLRKYDGRIWWSSHSNMGETRTVNQGFQLARGEIIGVLSSDDKLLPGAVTAAVETLAANLTALVAYPTYCYIDAQSQYMHDEMIPDHDYLKMVRRHFCYVGGGAFFRRQALALIGGRDPAFRYVGDFDFWLRLGLHGQFIHVPKRLAAIRVHPTSASVSSGRAMADEHIRLMRKFFALPNLPPEIRAVRSEAFAYARFHAARTCGTHPRAFTHYGLAMLNHPPVVSDILKSWILPNPRYQRLRVWLDQAWHAMLFVRRRAPVHLRRWLAVLTGGGDK